MCEGKPFKAHVANLVLGILAQHAKEGVDSRDDHVGGLHVFSRAGLVIQGIGSLVQVPFTWSIDKFIGVFKVIHLLLGRIAHESRAEHGIFALKELCFFWILDVNSGNVP